MHGVITSNGVDTESVKKSGSRRHSKDMATRSKGTRAHSGGDAMFIFTG